MEKESTRRTYELTKEQAYALQELVQKRVISPQNVIKLWSTQPLLDAPRDIRPGTSLFTYRNGDPTRLVSNLETSSKKHIKHLLKTLTRQQVAALPFVITRLQVEVDEDKAKVIEAAGIGSTRSSQAELDTQPAFASQ